MKARDITSSYVTLTQLADKRLPVKLALAVSRNLSKLAAEAETIERQRVRICEDCADHDTDGKPVMTESVIDGNRVSEYRIASERAEEFQGQISDLLDTDIPVSIMTVKPDVIELIDSDRYDPLTPAQLAGIEWMIED